MVKQDLDDALDEATILIDEIKPNLKKLVEKIENAKNAEGLLKKGEVLQILKRMSADLDKVDDTITDILAEL